MKIVNGRWVVDDNLTPIDERTSPAFVELGKKLKSIYGKQITHDRIDLVSRLNSLSDSDERALSRIIDEGLVSKI
jgi:hypothetical protein